MKTFKILPTIILFLLMLNSLLPLQAQEEKPFPSSKILLLSILDASDPFYIGKPVFSKDGKLLAAFFNGKKLIRIFETSTGQELTLLPPNMLFKNKKIDQILFLPDKENYLLVAKANMPLKIIDLKTGTIKKEIKIGKMGFKIFEMLVTNDNKYLIIAHQKGLTIWDLNENKLVKTFFPDRKIISIDISPDNKHLLAVKKGLSIESLSFIDLKQMIITKPLSTKTYHGIDQQVYYHNITSANFINDNLIIAAFDDDSPLSNNTKTKAGFYLVDLKDLQIKGPLYLTNNKVVLCKYIQNFKRLIIASYSTDNSGTVNSSLEFVDPEIFSTVSKSPDNKTLEPFIDANVSLDGKYLSTIVVKEDQKMLYLYIINLNDLK